MKYIVFNDKKVETNVFLQLQDLASVLTNIREMEFAYNYGHILDLKQKRITGSQFWENREYRERMAGLKTDVYLRAIGSSIHTNQYELYDYRKTMEKETHLLKFAAQLFTLLEDIRLEEICKKERPGTAKLFEIRREVYQKYFESQLITNYQKTYPIDELYCLIYLKITAKTPYLQVEAANVKQLNTLDMLADYLYEVYDATSTKKIAKICQSIVFRLHSIYEKDSFNEYFVYPFQQADWAGQKMDRKENAVLTNDDASTSGDEENETLDQSLSMWHREIETRDNETLLQFELENGTKTNRLGDVASEGDEGEQAMAVVQGHSNKSKKNEYSEKNVDEQINLPQEDKEYHSYGQENRYAKKIDKFPTKPSRQEEELYQTYVTSIDSYKRKLAQTIEKTLEHKKINPARNKLYGRLSKKLLPIAFENMPRVFYKKNSPSPEIDAVFTLLVDCSASMHDKMEETKKGITLFHEVLKKLKITHSVNGFWEDANEVREQFQPNYFHHIKTFENSLGHGGAEITQLQPEEDNRDGYSIRVMTEILLRRKEKHKFLLIFSDGEPAAANYEQNGIIDTHEAVLIARKNGIDVVGVFLANGEIIENDEQTMKNIYGREHILVPSVDVLAEQFAPLLKKLILKSI